MHLLVMDLHVSFLWVSDITDSQKLPVSQKEPEPLLRHVMLLSFTEVCVSIFSLETQHCAQCSRSLWGLFLMTSQFHNDIEQQLTAICTGCSHFYFQTAFIPLS